MIEEPRWDYRVLEIKRVTRVTAGGKRFKIRATVISGNMNGSVGVGIGKGNDIAQAVEKARKRAEKTAVFVIMKNQTIPYESEGKIGSSRVLIKPALKGQGLKAGGPVRTVLDLAGVPNASAKILGRTKNKLLNTLACLEALKKLSLYKINDIPRESASSLRESALEENVNTPSQAQE